MVKILPRSLLSFTLLSLISLASFTLRSLISLISFTLRSLISLNLIILSPFTSGYKKISTELANFKRPYNLFFAKAYQHQLFTNFISLSITWLCFTTYPIILFSLYAKIQQQVISSAITAVHATCIDLLAVILCKNYLTEAFNNAFKDIAIKLSMKWTNEVDAEKSVDALVRKKSEQNTPRTNIASFCSSFIELNKQLLQNLNKVSLAVLFILHYCNPSTFLAFLGCILCFYFVLSHINEKIKKLKNSHSVLDNKAIRYNEDSKHQQETYVGNTHQNDNRCNIIKENNIEIAETEIKISKLEKWRDWIADSCGNSVTPLIIGFGLSGFRKANIGIGVLFQIIQAFERCCNLFTQNGSLSTKLQSSFSVAEKLPTYWHDQDSSHSFYKRNNNEIVLTTLYTANIAAMVSLVLQVISVAYSFSTVNIGTNIFFAIYQTISPQTLVAGLGLIAFHKFLHKHSKHTLSRQINFDIAHLALALTGLLCIISSSALLTHSIPSITGAPMVILTACVHLVLSWSFQRNTIHTQPLPHKQKHTSQKPLNSNCVTTVIDAHCELKIELQGKVIVEDGDGKDFTCLEIPNSKEKVGEGLLSIVNTNPFARVHKNLHKAIPDQLYLPASTYFAKGDMGSGKSTLAKRLLFQALGIGRTENADNTRNKFFGKGQGSIYIRRPSTLINIFKPQEGDSTGTVKRPSMGKDLLEKIENYRKQEQHKKFSENLYGEKPHNSVTELQKYFYLDLISNDELPSTFDRDNHREIVKAYPKVQLLDLWDVIHANMIEFIGNIQKTDGKVMKCLKTQDLSHIENETESDGFSKKISGGNRCAFNAACIYAMLKVRLHDLAFSIFLDEPFNGSGDCRASIMFNLAQAAREDSKHSEPKPLLFVIAHEISEKEAANVFEHSIEFDPVMNDTEDKNQCQSSRSFKIKRTHNDLCAKKNWLASPQASPTTIPTINSSSKQ